MDTLGHINHTVPGNRSYHLGTFTNANHLFQRTANANGEMWLVVGAESAFEVPNVEFLVAKISATLATSSTAAVPAALLQDRSEISIFSKPAAPGILYVNAPPDLLPVSNARLFSLTGQEMALTMPAGNSIDIGNLKKGMYVLRVSTQKGTEHRETLITR
jgi:hypothetical protein